MKHEPVKKVLHETDCFDDDGNLIVPFEELRDSLSEMWVPAKYLLEEAEWVPTCIGGGTVNSRKHRDFMSWLAFLCLAAPRLNEEDITLPWYVDEDAYYDNIRSREEDWAFA